MGSRLARIGLTAALAVAACILAAAGPVRAPKLGEVFRDCEHCPEMVVIPGGTFAMGSDRNKEEKPVHIVSVLSVAFGRYEVTWGDWQACLDAKACTTDPDDHKWGKGKQPILNVSWNDANQYAAWLTKITGVKYRLPTEAEWEFAARGGTTTDYWWGNAVGEDHANCLYCNPSTWIHAAFPVGKYPPNAYGLFDMNGNQWEWVADCWVENYTGAPADGTARITNNCPQHVVRGGSWYFHAQNSRSASRDKFAEYSYDLGFRIVREL